MSISLIIIIITVAVSVWAFNNHQVFRRLCFNAYDIKHFNNHYRFISYALIHADWMHLIVNMFVLYSFGRIVESYYLLFFGIKGVMYFVLLYVGATALSTLAAFNKHKDDYSYTAVGASGAVSAVVFTSILFDPLSKLLIFPFPFGVPAIIFGVLYLIYSWYMSKKNMDNIGHDAHFWGAVFGFLFTIALKPSFFTLFIQKLAFVLQ